MNKKTEKTFTKDDYLTAAQLARLLNMDKNIVYAEMLKQYKRSTPIKYKSPVNNTILVGQMIIPSRSGGNFSKKTKVLRLNPHATQRFMEILQKTREG